MLQKRRDDHYQEPWEDITDLLSKLVNKSMQGTEKDIGDARESIEDYPYAKIERIKQMNRSRPKQLLPENSPTVFSSEDELENDYDD